MEATLDEDGWFGPAEDGDRASCNNDTMATMARDLCEVLVKICVKKNAAPQKKDV